MPTAVDPRVRRALGLVFAVVCTACAERQGGDADAATSGPDTETYPGACDPGVSPWQSSACLEGLSERCRGHDAQEDCLASGALTFGVGYTVACDWAKVVAFSDEASCTVASVRGRCEAVLVEGLSGACSDGCSDESLISSLSAFPSRGEIVDLCGGPLGGWSAIDADAGGEGGVCAANVSPPAPALCDCVAVACAAE